MGLTTITLCDQRAADSDKTVATGGATGSDGSLAEVKSNQVLTWDSLIAELYGHAKGSGNTNAQANIDLGAGNANNGSSRASRRFKNRLKASR